jgi:hypothetical protein
VRLVVAKHRAHAVGWVLHVDIKTVDRASCSNSWG